MDISNEIEVAPIDKTTILEIRAMIALPFWSRLTMLCIESKVNQKVWWKFRVYVLPIKPIAFYFLVPVIIVVVAQAFCNIKTLPREAIPEDARDAFVEKLMMC